MNLACALGHGLFDSVYGGDVLQERRGARVGHQLALSLVDNVDHVRRQPCMTQDQVEGVRPSYPGNPASIMVGFSGAIGARLAWAYARMRALPVAVHCSAAEGLETPGDIAGHNVL